MVEELIRRARRRFLLNETMAQFAFAAAVLVGGFVLMLIFGTRYLEWWTLGIFAAAGLGIGIYRVYRRTPDAYTTAVQLDENAQLHDALSTALYFSGGGGTNTAAGSQEFRAMQHAQAENVAREVQLERAAPFVVPRSLYAMAALCVLASCLIALRFGMGHGLNLRAPLTQVLFEDESIRDAKKAQALYPKSQKWMEQAQSLLSKLGMGPNPTEPPPSDPDALDKAIEQALQNPASAGAKTDKGAGKDGESKAGDAGKDSQQDGDPIAEDEQAQDNHGQDGATPKAGEQNSKSGSGKSSSSPSNRESLLSRLKDAVSNLLKQDKGDNSSADKKDQSAKNESQGSQKGQAGKSSQQKGESQSDADGQPDADAQNNQQAQGRLNSANQTASQGGSGIGSQDGSKEIKEAAQLKAMGKISEIIGQRAATVTGETSVEVESGSQKLHTDYSNVTAAHGEADGDVTRDEIPLALQAYVQQYFAEVRKSGTPAKPKAETAAPKP